MAQKPTPAAAPKPAPQPAPAPAPVANTPVTASQFVIEDSIPLPAVVRKVGLPSNGPTYPLAGMNVGQSFLIPVTVPTTLTNPDNSVKTYTDAERTVMFKAECRKISNRISGAIRRHRKDPENKLHAFAVRQVGDANTDKSGVRVWRQADETPAPAAPAPAAA